MASRMGMERCDMMLMSLRTSPRSQGTSGLQAMTEASAFCRRGGKYRPRTSN